jgi:hypothetical protein
LYPPGKKWLVQKYKKWRRRRYLSLSIYLCLYLSIYLSTSLSIYLSIYLVYLSISRSLSLSIYIYINTYIHTYIHTYTYIYSERLEQGSQVYPPGKKWLVQKYKNWRRRRCRELVKGWNKAARCTPPAKSGCITVRRYERYSVYLLY